MLTLLALFFACEAPTPVITDAQPEATASSNAFAAPTAEVPVGPGTSRGSAKINMGCFGSQRDEMLSMSAGYGGAPSVMPAPPPSTSSRSMPTPKSSPAKTPMGAVTSTADASAASGVPEAAPRPADKRKEAAVYEAEESRDDSWDRGPVAQTPALTRTYDWGATTYLSNDDSMSLASAQRILWAVQNDAGISAQEVRPHELLNYFSFDTATPAGNDLFGIQTSAAKTGVDSMSFAFSVKGITPERKPLDLTMVIDRSGSMSSEGRMEYVKTGLNIMTTSLVRGDRVDIVLFDDQLCTPLEDFVVGRDNPDDLTRVINAMAPRGSTDIGIGLREGYRIASAPARMTDKLSRNHRVMLLTDALVNTGDIDPETISQIGKEFDSHNIRLTGVGVGRDFNDKVLDELTEQGKGAYVYLGSEAVVKRVFGTGFESLVQTIAHDVHFSLDLPDSLAIERFYGEESSTVKEDVQAINYYAGTSQLFLQDLKVDPAKLKPTDAVVLNIEYTDATTGAQKTQSFKTTVGSMMTGDTHNLTKARALMSWTDMVATRAMGGDACGASFQDWSDRAAEVADDAEIAYVGTLASKWCGAPHPMPKISPVAYKVRVDSDVAIAEVAMWCGQEKQTQSLTGSDSVARFTSVSPGSCTVTLEGQVPMQVAVEVPVNGGDLRCLVRGGRVNCS